MPSLLTTVLSFILVSTILSLCESAVKKKTELLRPKHSEVKKKCSFDDEGWGGKSKGPIQCEYTCHSFQCLNVHIKMPQKDKVEYSGSETTIDCPDAYSCVGALTIDAQSRQMQNKGTISCQDKACRDSAMRFHKLFKATLTGQVKESEILFQNTMVVDILADDSKWQANKVYTKQIWRFKLTASKEDSASFSTFYLNGVTRNGYLKLSNGQKSLRTKKAKKPLLDYIPAEYPKEGDEASVDIYCEAKGSCAGSWFILDSCSPGITFYCAPEACNMVVILVIESSKKACKSQKVAIDIKGSKVAPALASPEIKEKDYSHFYVWSAKEKDVAMGEKDEKLKYLKIQRFNGCKGLHELEEEMTKQQKIYKEQWDEMGETKKTSIKIGKSQIPKRFLASQATALVAIRSFEKSRFNKDLGKGLKILSIVKGFSGYLDKIKPLKGIKDVMGPLAAIGAIIDFGVWATKLAIEYHYYLKNKRLSKKAGLVDDNFSQCRKTGDGTLKPLDDADAQEDYDDVYGVDNAEDDDDFYQGPRLRFDEDGKLIEYAWFDQSSNDDEFDEQSISNAMAIDSFVNQALDRLESNILTREQDNIEAAENVRSAHHGHRVRSVPSYFAGEALKGYDAMSNETFLSGNNLNIWMILFPLIGIACCLYATFSIMCCCMSTISLFKERIVGYVDVGNNIKYDELSDAV